MSLSFESGQKPGFGFAIGRLVILPFILSGSFILLNVLTPNETKSITAFIGTPEYLAPEILNTSGGKFTQASDVWALGIIFHKILTNNEHPFLPKSEESNTNRDVNLNIIMENMNKNKMKLSKTITNPLYLNVLTGFLFNLY